MRHHGAVEFGDSPGPDDDLTRAVTLAQRGDDAAFLLLYRAVQPRLLRYVRALVGGDADDVASEAWLQIVRDLRSFAGDFGAFRAWTATVARNRAMDHLRHAQRRPVLPAPAELLAALPGGQDTAAGAIDLVATRRAIAIIAGLPRDQAEAVLLRVVMGLDAPAAAQVLGKRAGAVRVAAHRGLHKLAEQLGGAGGSRAVLGMSDAARRTGVTPRRHPALKDLT